MGQYFLVVNKTKKEYLYPHIFDDGLKLLEFGCSSDGTMTALALLLRQSSEGGGGDFDEPEKFPIVGSWAGDSITIVGDYDESELFKTAEESYKNVSFAILEAMANGDEHLAKDVRARIKNRMEICDDQRKMQYMVILRNKEKKQRQ